MKQCYHFLLPCLNFAHSCTQEGEIEGGKGGRGPPHVPIKDFVKAFVSKSAIKL
jgi:hypothetical protein